MKKLLFLGLCSTALLLPAQRPDFERKAYPPKPEGGLRVVVFGDSITGHRPAQDYQKNYLKYSDLLGLMIEAKVGVGKVQMINSGWAGDMTWPKKNEGWPGALGRVQVDLVDYKPDIAIILIGGNDKAITPEKQARSKENLIGIYSAAKASGAKVLALQYHDGLPDPKNPDKFWGHLAKASDPLIAEAAAAAGVELHSLAADFNKAAEQMPHKDLVAWPDGVHLKPAGEMIVARSIFSKLDELGWIETP